MRYFKHIKFNIFPSDCLVFLNYDIDDKEDIYKQLNKTIKHKSTLLNLIQSIDKANFSGNLGLTFVNGPYSVIIIDKFNIDSVNDISTLLHESLHVVFNVGRYVGFFHSEESEEFFTYMTEFIFKEILNGYEKSYKEKHKSISTGEPKNVSE